MARRITISADVYAPIDHVWTCYTDPKHITKWNFANDDWCCPWAENDMRVGGVYRARMEAKDGNFGFEFEAVYDAIIPQQSLQYTLPDGRIIETQFTEIPEGTRVRTIFDAEAENSTEMQREGWQSILDNFKSHAEETSAS